MMIQNTSLEFWIDSLKWTLMEINQTYMLFLTLQNNHETSLMMQSLGNNEQIKKAH